MHLASFLSWSEINGHNLSTDFNIYVYAIFTYVYLGRRTYQEETATFKEGVCGGKILNL